MKEGTPDLIYTVYSPTKYLGQITHTENKGELPFLHKVLDWPLSILFLFLLFQDLCPFIR